MGIIRKVLFTVLFSWVYFSYAQENLNGTPIQQWGKYEASFKGPENGNPFTDISLIATFSNGSKKINVTGFYDGNGSYKIRFMPTTTGEWTYITESNNKSLSGKSGKFVCVRPTGQNHGPVVVANTYHFKYADGKPYYPFGTTSYAWNHQKPSLEEETLKTLASAPFNKIRMCVFPKWYNYVEEEPQFYPYKIKSQKKDNKGILKFEWDFARFDPSFFQHLEKRIDDLDKLGIEADLIIFHPYDKGHWGFDNMGKQNDTAYLKYLTARLSSFKNVWWSMANEFDFVKSKSRQDWDDYTKTVVDNDPYHHLCSIHNGSAYFDNWKPAFTHASIQNGSAVEDFGRAVLLRDAYIKPVIYDEVCYEGDLPLRWGRLSGEEMTEAFWQGIIAGTYVTHGETYRNPNDVIFWAKGGKLRGTSPARIGFLRKIIEEGPGPLHLADQWKDHRVAQADSNYYIIYFGKQMQDAWQFNLPKKNASMTGAKFKAEIIDTWNMTITPVSETFELSAPDDYRIVDKQLKKIRLPMKPYLAIRLVRI